MTDFKCENCIYTIYFPKTVLGVIKNTNTKLDGLTVQLSLWNYEKGSWWSFDKWCKEDDKQVMEVMYEAKKEHPRYVNTFENFQKEWEAGEYEQSGAYWIDLDKVDVQEIIKEEKYACKREDGICNKQTFKDLYINLYIKKE